MLNLFENLIDALNADQFEKIDFSHYKELSLQIYKKDLKSKYLACNDYMACSSGWSKESDLLNKTDFDMCWSNEAMQMQANDRQILCFKKPMLFLEPATRPEGHKINALSYKLPLRLHNKKIAGMIGLSIDLCDTTTSLLSITKKILINNPTSFKKTITVEKYINKDGLTKRQSECLYLLCRGFSFKQIANHLNLSARTVEHYIETVKAKLNCYSREELIERYSF